MSRICSKIKVALVVPHISIIKGVFENVVFSPGQLAFDLAQGLGHHDIDVTLFTPGPADTRVKNITADMTGFNNELKNRGYGYMELLAKHPLVFISSARQVQAEIISKAYEMANSGEFDLVHIYTNEEDIALQFANLCTKPVVFTHHDPFNFLIRYKSVFPRYKNLNFISISKSQRKSMPDDTNWLANIYHGIDLDEFEPSFNEGEYFAYIGRIVEPKGVHLAVEAVKKYNETASSSIKLKIAGKYYNEWSDSYFESKIKPLLDENIEYVGYLTGQDKKYFLKNAKALIVPSTFEEPFGMVTLEAMASGTPVIGFNVGATSEIVRHGQDGFIIDEISDEARIDKVCEYIDEIAKIDRHNPRKRVEADFSLEKMIKKHADLYKKLTS